MNVQVVAAIISGASELIGEVIRNRKPKEEEKPLTASISLGTLVDEEPKKRKPYFIIDPEHDQEDEENETPKHTSTKKAIKKPASVSLVSVSGEIEEPEKHLRKTGSSYLASDLPAGSVVVEEEPVEENKATAIPTGCIPCSLGHVGTCTGLLNEATRFARGPEGAQSGEVIDRVNMCLDELNSLEREDLRPEKVTQLKGWERDLAEQILETSRATRHKLEDVTNLNTRGLEEIAGSTQTLRQDIGRKWFQNKIANLSQADQDKIKSRVMEKLAEMREQAASGRLGSTDELADADELDE